MCRACHAIVVAGSDAHNRLRRAAGLEVQVVALTTSFAEASAMDPAPDVLIVHADAADLEQAPEPAVVWVGADPPDWVDASVPDDDGLNDALPGAVVRALIQRRKR